MINLVRKIVAGPKNRTVDEQFDLDLTYITPNVIAMAFPASGLEKAYRNSIHDVVRFMRLRHGPSNYRIINASNRKYDYSQFDDQVQEFFWTDHQAPPITTMFQLCDYIDNFLKASEQHAVAVHCNHGKGRTGTAIIAYLLFSGRFLTVKEALKYYNETRFQEGKLAVDQPCQLRYINYFKSFLQLPINFLEHPLKVYKVKKIQQKGLDPSKQLYVRISQTRTEHQIYPCIPLNVQQIKFVRPLIGDIFIELFQQSWTGSKRLLRINFHLFFLSKNTETNTYQVIFIGDEIKMKHAHEEFEFVLEFEEYCHCHEVKDRKKDCLCQVKRDRQQAYWDDMVKIIAKNRKKAKQEIHNCEDKVFKNIHNLKQAEFEELNYEKEFPPKIQHNQQDSQKIPQYQQSFQ